jgi:hypothetical protein
MTVGRARAKDNGGRNRGAVAVAPEPDSESEIDSTHSIKDFLTVTRIVNGGHIAR